MKVKADFRIRSAVFTDQQQIANLIHFGPHVHRHLDWRNPLDWFGSSPFLIAEDQGELAAALACPPDPPRIAWIRLFADSGKKPLEEVWQTLWAAARQELARNGESIAPIIVLQEWFRGILEASGFTRRQEIIMLERERQPTVEAALPDGFSIRRMMPFDMPTVAEVDAAAFDPVWQNSLETLNRAYPQAMLATVAESPAGVIGYQISTRNPFGAHLARLAVRPEAQGQGVGRVLVLDLLRQLTEHGVSRLTVNTQNDNLTSLSLYAKIGFRETGERYPVYQFLVSS